MKLKYYLRGLGIGIMITALVLLIAGKVNGHMSDKEVIERAEKLGMVMKETEKDTLFPDTESESDKVTEEAAAEEETEETTAEGEEETEPDTEEPETEIETEAEEEPSDEETEALEPVQEEQQPVVYTLTISEGMYSEAVSERLAEAGIVESAADFNRYLEDNGFAVRIKIGTYDLTSGMSYYDIAAMIIQ